MSELMKYAESADLYSKISNLITAKKYTVSRAVNSAIVFLYWEIGETVCMDILQNHKAEYGKAIINEVAKQLSQNYGKGFDRTAIFRNMTERELQYSDLHHTDGLSICLE